MVPPFHQVWTATCAKARSLGYPGAVLADRRIVRAARRSYRRAVRWLARRDLRGA